LSTFWAVNLTFREHDLTRKDIVTFGACETGLMPFLFKSRDAHSIDWLVALSTNGTSSLMVVFLAIRLTFIFEEFAIRESFVTFGASEVISVPVFIECSDCSSVSYGLMAFSAGISEQFIIMLEAVWIFIFFEEFSIRERLIADSAAEALFMEVLVQGFKITSFDGFFATRAGWKERRFITFEAVSSAIFIEKLFRSNVFSAIGARKAREMIKSTQSL